MLPQLRASAIEVAAVQIQSGTRKSGMLATVAAVRAHGYRRLLGLPLLRSDAALLGPTAAAMAAFSVVLRRANQLYSPTTVKPSAAFGSRLSMQQPAVLRAQCSTTSGCVQCLAQ